MLQKITGAGQQSPKCVCPDGPLLDAGRRLSDLNFPLSQLIKPESYLEIGVAGGKSLGLVNSQTKAIGIDPSPHEGVESHARLYKMPSNEFFESYNLFEELGTSRVSLDFIDGLHIFEQALMVF
jgi:hypothetical protein